MSLKLVVLQTSVILMLNQDFDDLASLRHALTISSSKHLQACMHADTTCQEKMFSLLNKSITSLQVHDQEQILLAASL